MPKPSAHLSTRDRILIAAEDLFAQYGFAGTSLRQVTAHAEVNIAAVNYHFGSKESLINEVFRRHMDNVSIARINALSEALTKHPGELEPILTAFIEPAMQLPGNRQGGDAFVRIIARAYAEENDVIRQFMADNYGYVLVEFTKAISACLPHLSKEQLIWRLDFLSGALTYATADFGINRLCDRDSEEDHYATASSQLIRFAKAGFMSA